ncbi:DsbA family protein [Zestomonas carbonaria]|uniref:DSBA-like thioredoxin domain-containing protein n=1 Tax=Zestomonas carbonaria TaxID=2762745 RepID=A0A7U7I9Z7_9GAMM|nr:DsbA family protein [Pseudomonas carbonaria]CAD5107442.1 hypothetical protein PSEWESI4_01715 [Pseudomonas carbonaria]
MNTLSVEMSFDFICPWCLIGKRNLDRALRRLRALRPEQAIELRWRGRQLLPFVPAEGLPFAEFYLGRLGSESAVLARLAQVQAAAALAGVDIDLQRIQSMPNTANAHRLLERAADLGSPAQLEALLERLFAAYFQHGEDLGDRATLLSTAQSCGFDPQWLEPVLRDDARPFIERDTELRGTGVPGFVFGGRLAQVGAQQPEVLLHSLQRACAREPS